MMNKQNYKKFFKILISNLLFLLIIFNQNAISKAIPPGSGEGDVARRSRRLRREEV